MRECVLSDCDIFAMVKSVDLGGMPMELSFGVPGRRPRVGE